MTPLRATGVAYPGAGPGPDPTSGAPRSPSVHPDGSGDASAATKADVPQTLPRPADAMTDPGDMPRSRCGECGHGRRRCSRGSGPIPGSRGSAHGPPPPRMTHPPGAANRARGEPRPRRRRSADRRPHLRPHQPDPLAWLTRGRTAEVQPPSRPLSSSTGSGTRGWSLWRRWGESARATGWGRPKVTPGSMHRAHGAWLRWRSRPCASAVTAQAAGSPSSVSTSSRVPTPALVPPDDLRERLSQLTFQALDVVLDVPATMSTFSTASGVFSRLSVHFRSGPDVVYVELPAAQASGRPSAAGGGGARQVNVGDPQPRRAGRRRRPRHARRGRSPGHPRRNRARHVAPPARRATARRRRRTLRGHLRPVVPLDRPASRREHRALDARRRRWCTSGPRPTRRRHAILNDVNIRALHARREPCEPGAQESLDDPHHGVNEAVTAPSVCPGCNRVLPDADQVCPTCELSPDGRRQVGRIRAKKPR